MIKFRGSTVNKFYCSKFSRVMSPEVVLAVSYNVMCIEVIVKCLLYITLSNTLDMVGSCCCCIPFSTIIVVNPGSPGLESSVLVSS